MSRPRAPEPVVVGSSVRAIRDLTIWSQGDVAYVVACDANASIGQLPHDFMSRPPEEAGYNAAKVALMEVVATGARPFLVTNTLCGPLDGYGTRVVAGVRRAVWEVAHEAVVTGSDETNMATSQTGVGVTVIGRGPLRDLRVGTSRAHDIVVCLGRPKDGVTVPYREGDPDVASPLDVLRVMTSGVHETLPVGSKGVANELGQLAAGCGLRTEIATAVTVDLTASAGASTCFLASLHADDLPELRGTTDLPVEVVATLRARPHEA